MSYWRAETPARYGVKVISPPMVEPITLADSRLHLRIDPYESTAGNLDHPDDPLISGCISDARDYCEQYLGRALAPQTLELAVGRFPGSNIWNNVADCVKAPCVNGSAAEDAIMLPMAPVIAIQSVTYLDADGLEQTFAVGSYSLDNFSEPGWLHPAFSVEWPTTQAMPNAVKVRYLAGYSTPGDSPDSNPLPRSIRRAMLLLIGHFYERREHASTEELREIPLGVEALLKPYQLRLAMA